MLEGVGFDERKLPSVPDLDVLAIRGRDEPAVPGNLHTGCRALGLEVADGLARPNVVQPAPATLKCLKTGEYRDLTIPEDKGTQSEALRPAIEGP